MRPKSPLTSPTRTAILVGFIIILFVTYQSLLSSNSTRVQSELEYHPPANEKTSDSLSKHPSEPPVHEEPKKPDPPNKVVWEKLRTLLRDTRPENEKITLLRSLDTFDGGVPKNVDDVPDVVDMSKGQMDKMKAAHSKFVKKIQAGAVKLHYKQGTRGVVTTASTKDLGSVVMSLAMLRRTGCELPVEVLVSTDTDAKSAMCAEVLANLNAKCISTAASIGLLVENPELQNNRYLNKLFALLFSSFDDNLFLDADNLPVIDPSSYFDNEPYMSRGLVAWPDFWPSSISKKHAEITSTTKPPINGTVESGELLISKNLHADTLLLAFYYNFYGPDYYYLLESQGAVGFGDKETFLNAALALNNPYYLISQGIQALGYWDAGNFVGPAMAQFDLLQDYRNHLNHLTPESPSYQKPRVTFVHHNMLKLVPGNIFGDKGHAEYTKLKSGKFTRLWGPKEDTEAKFEGEDVEERMWKTLKEVTCNLKGKGLLEKQGGWTESDECTKCDEYIKAVFSGHDSEKKETDGKVVSSSAT